MCSNLLSELLACCCCQYDEVGNQHVAAGIHRKRVIKRVIKVIQLRAQAGGVSENEMKKQIGGQYVELAKCMLMAPMLPDRREGMIAYLLEVLVPKPSNRVVAEAQHSKMITQGPPGKAVQVEHIRLTLG